MPTKNFDSTWALVSSGHYLFQCSLLPCAFTICLAFACRLLGLMLGFFLGWQRFHCCFCMVRSHSRVLGANRGICRGRFFPDTADLDKDPHLFYFVPALSCCYLHWNQWFKGLRFQWFLDTLPTCPHQSQVPYFFEATWSLSTTLSSLSGDTVCRLNTLT